MKPIVIVDIDGTIADVRHRLHHIKGPGKKNWKAFFEAMDHDSPIEAMIRHVHELEKDHDIIIVTGRPEHYRARTEKWLKDNGVRYSRLFMRPDGDHRPDYAVKVEVLREYPKGQIVLAIDDRGPVCDMYEKNGVRCLRVESDEENQQVNELYREKPS
jgi:phosphoglycolate phosphatase-like HAD superfamily hydrolase